MRLVFFIVTIQIMCFHRTFDPLDSNIIRYKKLLPKLHHLMVRHDAQELNINVNRFYHINICMDFIMIIVCICAILCCWALVGLSILKVKSCWMIPKMPFLAFFRGCSCIFLTLIIFSWTVPMHPGNTLRIPSWVIRQALT